MASAVAAGLVTTPAYAGALQALLRCLEAPGADDRKHGLLLAELADVAATEAAREDASPATHRELLSRMLYAWACGSRRRPRAVLAAGVQLRIVVREAKVDSRASHLAIETMLAMGRGWAPAVARDAVTEPAAKRSTGNPRRRHFAEGVVWALCRDGLSTAPWSRRAACKAFGVGPGDVLHMLQHMATAPAASRLLPGEMPPC